MTFNITTSKVIYSDPDVIKRLTKLGFTFEGLTSDPSRYVVSSSSRTVEFRTLEDLLEFVKEWGKCVIFPNGTIEIYDCYRE